MDWRVNMCPYVIVKRDVMILKSIFLQIPSRLKLGRLIPGIKRGIHINKNGEINKFHNNCYKDLIEYFSLKLSTNGNFFAKLAISSLLISA